VPVSKTHKQPPAPAPICNTVTNRVALYILLVLLVCISPLPAQTNSTPSLGPTDLVRRAVQHRLDAARTHRPMQFLIHRTDPRLDSTKLVVETKDGDVARLVAIDHKPLPADAEKAEMDRLDLLAQHPEKQEHTRANEQKDTERVAHILSLLPDALLYHMEGFVPCGADQCYWLSFKPNPSFNPPDLESNILTGVDGEVWIDQAQERLVRLDAHFIKDVNFGFGILGRLNKGGTVLLQQTNVGNNDWELTGLEMHITGKALMVRSLNFQIKEETSHFSQVTPRMDYREAIHMLKSYDAAKTSYTP
jgi:hypothetical protein